MKNPWEIISDLLLRQMKERNRIIGKNIKAYSIFPFIPTLLGGVPKVQKDNSATSGGPQNDPVVNK